MNVKHVHEFLGSTEVEESHMHRFAGVTFEAIVLANGKHKHRFFTNTDFYEDHHHEIKGFTGVDILIGDGRHIHFVILETTLKDNHQHVYRLSLIHISEPTRRTPISYAVFCLKK